MFISVLFLKLSLFYYKHKAYYFSNLNVNEYNNSKGNSTSHGLYVCLCICVCKCAYVCILAYACTHVSWHRGGNQKTTCTLCPFTMWVPGIKLKSSSLLAGSFTCWIEHIIMFVFTSSLFFKFWNIFCSQSSLVHVSYTYVEFYPLILLLNN